MSATEQHEAAIAEREARRERLKEHEKEVEAKRHELAEAEVASANASAPEDVRAAVRQARRLRAELAEDIEVGKALERAIEPAQQDVDRAIIALEEEESVELREKADAYSAAFWDAYDGLEDAVLSLRGLKAKCQSCDASWRWARKRLGLTGSATPPIYSDPMAAVAKISQGHHAKFIAPLFAGLAAFRPKGV